METRGENSLETVVREGEKCGEGRVEGEEGMYCKNEWKNDLILFYPTVPYRNLPYALPNETTVGCRGGERREEHHLEHTHYQISEDDTRFPSFTCAILHFTVKYAI